MSTVMRNTQTGEYRRLDGDSQTPEYQALAHTLRTDGRPMWEETGLHDMADFLTRKEAGDIKAEDVGDAGQPTEVLSGTPSNLRTIPSGTVDRGQPSAVEAQNGVGRADDDAGVSTVFGEMPEPDDEGGLIPIGAAPGTVTDSEFPEEVEGPDPADVHSIRSDAETDPSDGSSGESKSDLQEAARQRGLPTSGSKADLQSRIAEHDQAAA